MSPRSRPRVPLHIALVSAAALAFVSGCGSSSPAPEQPAVQETMQCVVADNNAVDGYTVVDDDFCDDDGDGHGGGGSFVFLSGHNSYPRGTRLNNSQFVRPPIRYNDSTGRQNAGLAPTGKVQSGQRTVSGAGIGKGSTGGNTGGSTGS